MKKPARAASLTTVGSSRCDALSRAPTRLPSACFDSALCSPVARRVAKRRQRPRPSAPKTGRVQTLEFRSQVRRKKYKLQLFDEDQVLVLRRATVGKLIDTPGADFDCDSDEELIASTIRQKVKELRAGLRKAAKAQQSN